MKQTRISTRGQAVIPREIREELGIKPHSRLAWSARNGVIIAIPVPEDPVAASIGILGGKGFTLKDFLAERQKERALEREREARLDAQVRRGMDEP
jgi:AbrB family looped-hinge helix DNA binding protein